MDTSSNERTRRYRTNRASRTERLDVRVTAEHSELIKAAAEARGATVSSFVLDVVVPEAEKTLAEQRQRVVLPNEVFDAFIAALDAPAEPVPELVKLFSRHRVTPLANERTVSD
jgi:uncharacterized protein (DUF1778 family)